MEKNSPLFKSAGNTLLNREQVSSDDARVLYVRKDKCNLQFLNLKIQGVRNEYQVDYFSIKFWYILTIDFVKFIQKSFFKSE